jgi:hypothetical protein
MFCKAWYNDTCIYMQCPEGQNLMEAVVVTEEEYNANKF